MNNPNHLPPVPIIFELNNTQPIPITRNINVRFDDTDNNIRINIRIDNNNNNIIIPIPISHTTLQENSDELLGNENISNNEKIRRYMMIRTICDIIKDATNARVTVPRNDVLIPLLNELFPRQIVSIAEQPAKLEEMKAISNNKCEKFMSGRVFIKSAYTDHIPLPVTHVFNESGVEPDTFSPIGAIIMSSFASVADPATRKVPTRSFPGENDTLHFESTFMRGLVGFLEQTRWWAKQMGVFRPDNNTQYKFEINVGNNNIVHNNSKSINATKNNIDKTDFSDPISRKGYYFQGNPTKNKFITKYPGDLTEILRYMIIKEMGDMMQVYVMLVWFYLQNPQITKDKFVMSTTDLVVMNTCQLFKMPCLYTNQGKDSSMLSEEDKKVFDVEFNNKMKQRANGNQIYQNWKKNNKFANTLYYLPFEESLELKKTRRLNTIYYLIKTQNEKQLGIFQKANIGKLRYIKMGRLGPLMTSFSNDIMTEIIPRIIQNIQTINHNLLVEYNRLNNSLINNPDEYNGDETDIRLKKHFSLHILITRQKYPPTVGNTYVYVIQNLTHYTEEVPIGDGTSKLVDMMLDKNIENFKTVDRTEGVTTNPVLNTIFPNPKISGPGPNENWLIYSIANWFNGVRNQLNTMFGDLFQPFNFLDNVDTMDWMGIGGAAHKYTDEINGTNNLEQPYINIGFVTMMPSIYEQLCSIYEKHNIVYDDDFGQTFIIKFILNLTRYNNLSMNNLKIIPTLTSPYNDIGGRPSGPGANGNPDPYSFHLIDNLEMNTNTHLPYEKCVIHTADIDFDIKNIRDSNVEFKEQLIAELENKKIELIANNNIDNNNVFTVDDDFARALFEKSGLIFVEEQEELTTPMNGSPQATAIATPISSQKDLEAYLSPENEMNRQKLFDFIITPLKEKQIPQLENIMLDNIDLNLELLYSILNQIKNGDIPLEENLKKIIINFMETSEIPNRERGVTLDFGETPPFSMSDDEKSEMDGTTGGKFIKNKKTRRRNKRSHKKHHKTNKRHKKHKKSGKNKTRKTKKAKRKNRTV